MWKTKKRFVKWILGWYETNRQSFPWREASRTPYEILVAELMLQRTIAIKVKRIYETVMTMLATWKQRVSDPSQALAEKRFSCQASRDFENLFMFVGYKLRMDSKSPTGKTTTGGFAHKVPSLHINLGRGDYGRI